MQHLGYDPKMHTPETQNQFWHEQQARAKELCGDHQANAVQLGTVKSWIEDKGIGFITRQDGAEIYVHRSALKDPVCGRLIPGDHVAFATGPSTTGKLEEAQTVTVTQRTIVDDEGLARSPKRARTSNSGWLQGHTITKDVNAHFAFIRPDGGGPDQYVSMRIPGFDQLEQGRAVGFKVGPASGKPGKTEVCKLRAAR